MKFGSILLLSKPGPLMKLLIILVPTSVLRKRMLFPPRRLTVIRILWPRARVTRQPLSFPGLVRRKRSLLMIRVVLPLTLFVFGPSRRGIWRKSIRKKIIFLLLMVNTITKKLRLLVFPLENTRRRQIRNKWNMRLITLLTVVIVMNPRLSPVRFVSLGLILILIQIVLVLLIKLLRLRAKLSKLVSLLSILRRKSTVFKFLTIIPPVPILLVTLFKNGRTLRLNRRMKSLTLRRRLVVIIFLILFTRKKPLQSVILFFIILTVLTVLVLVIVLNINRLMVIRLLLKIGLLSVCRRPALFLVYLFLIVWRKRSLSGLPLLKLNLRRFNSRCRRHGHGSSSPYFSDGSLSFTKLKLLLLPFVVTILRT